MQYVYVPMEMIVPMKNVAKNEMASTRGSASAGKRRNNESGCNPWMVPVMYVHEMKLLSRYTGVSVP